MREIDLTSREHDAIAELLPWFLNRTLPATEHEKMAQHVEQCPRCRDDSAILLEAMNGDSVADAVPAAGEARLRRVLSRIDDYEADRRAGDGARGPKLTKLLRTLADWFAAPKRPLGLAFGLAAALMVAFFAAQSRGPADTGVYDVRSDAAAPATTLTLLVRFEDGADAAARAAALRTAGLDLPWRDGGDGRIVIELPPATPVPRVAEWIDALQRQSEIAEVATQLP